jgi:2,3-dihydroxybiphenyl 1,2-dioxygenase
VLYAGWEVSDADTLDALRARLQAAGLAVTPGSATEASERAVRDFIRFKDADGNTLEAFYGATVRNDDPFCSPLGRGPFITGEQGLGHIVLQAEDYEAQVRFYTRTLAFKVTDYNDVDIPGLGPNAHLTFLHVNPRHHSLALGNFPIGRRFNHLMLEVSSLDDVGFAYERAKKSGAHILFDLGRHSNDNVFSFYVLTPSGWAVEVGWGGIHVDDATWHVTHHRATSTWGHRFMPPTKA